MLLLTQLRSERCFYTQLQTETRKEDEPHVLIPMSELFRLDSE